MILHKTIYFYYIDIALRLIDLNQTDTSLPSVVGLTFCSLSVYLFSSVFLFYYSYVPCSLVSSISFYIFILFYLLSFLSQALFYVVGPSHSSSSFLSLSYVKARSQNYEKRLLHSSCHVCLSVHIYQTQHPLDGFSRNFVFE